MLATATPISQGTISSCSYEDNPGNSMEVVEAETPLCAVVAVAGVLSGQDLCYYHCLCSSDCLPSTSFMTIF